MFQSLLLVMATVGSRLCGHYIFILWFLLSFFLFIFLRQKLPSAHHRTTLSGYIFATKACIPTIGKKLAHLDPSNRLATVHQRYR